MTESNSMCGGGLYHDYQIIRSTVDGVIEQCSRCKDRQFFRHNVNNSHYLSFHLRSALQKRDIRFNREYAVLS